MFSANFVGAKKCQGAKMQHRSGGGDNTSMRGSEEERRNLYTGTVLNMLKSRNITVQANAGCAPRNLSAALSDVEFVALEYASHIIGPKTTRFAELRLKESRRADFKSPDERLESSL